MIKHVFAIAAAISLLLCVGIGCLWFQSYRVGAGARRRFVLNLGRQMYMLRCDPGHVSVFRSPDTVAATQADAHVCDDARRIRNDDLDWKGWTWTDDDGSCSVFSWDPSVLASPAATDLAANCMPPQSPAVVPALLRAIDDPERFAVAHVLLVAATSTGPSPRSSLPEIEIRTPGEKELLSYCGLDLPIARADSNLDYHHYHLNRILSRKRKGLTSLTRRRSRVSRRIGTTAWTFRCERSHMAGSSSWPPFPPSAGSPSACGALSYGVTGGRTVCAWRAGIT